LANASTRRLPRGCHCSVTDFNRTMQPLSKLLERGMLKYGQNRDEPCS
jgi:hypothetical protein